MKKTLAHNIVISIDQDLVLAGTTDIDMSIEPEYEESIVKDDDGEPDLDHTGRSPLKFTVSGLHEVLDTEGEDLTHVDIEELRKVVDDGEAHHFIFGDSATAGKVAYGSLIITKLSEKSGPSGVPEWSIDCECEDPTYTTRDAVPVGD